MASRVAEVIYRIKDLFTGPARKIGDAYGRIRAGSKRTAEGVQRDNRRMSASFGSLTSKLKTFVGVFASGFAGRATVASLGEVADELDRLGKTAARLDIDPNQLAALEFAADRSGVAIDKMTASIGTLQKRTGEALQGIGQARLAFDRLGISASEFAALDAEQQLVTIANALQAVASEEERAALAAQLFSKANSDLLNELNDGGPALTRLIEQGKSYRNITQEATEAAAKYNDALTDLNASIDALKFENLTPLIEFAGTRLNVRGLGDPIEGLRSELALLEDQVNKPFLARLFGFRGVSRRNTMARRIDEIKVALRQFERQQEKAEKGAQMEADARAMAAKAAGAYKLEIEGLTDAYAAQAKVQKESLATQTAELRSARNAQKGIEAEFRGLVDSITQPEQGDVFLLDVFEAIRKSKFALDSGEIEAAIDQARAGGDLLGQLKDKGTETQGTLTFLAKQLQTVATAAAKKRTAAELIDVKQAEGALDGLTNKLGALKTDAAVQGTAIGKALLAAIQVELDGAALRLPAVAAPAVTSTAAGEPGEPTTRIVREGNTFYRTALDKAGAK